jgi:hypothetical protein
MFFPYSFSRLAAIATSSFNRNAYGYKQKCVHTDLSQLLLLHTHTCINNIYWQERYFVAVFIVVNNFCSVAQELKFSFIQVAAGYLATMAGMYKAICLYDPKSSGHSLTYSLFILLSSPPPPTHTHTKECPCVKTYTHVFAFPSPPQKLSIASFWFQQGPDFKPVAL